ncbi:hypothetical protein NP493_425g03012 [Ridgeia piscesae]|uniref:Uncharacterized protein n=1 Tax=Ridgeia piscesae TaxID=27915 RepID=A0AAD9L0I7_RIDPI|nr:hypothetical protein NP493_425g03012 [Ridgeia piscesae]
MQEIDDMYNSVLDLAESPSLNYPQPAISRVSPSLTDRSVYSGELLPRFKMVTPLDRPPAVTAVSRWPGDSTDGQPGLTKLMPVMQAMCTAGVFDFTHTTSHAPGSPCHAPSDCADMPRHTMSHLADTSRHMSPVYETLLNSRCRPDGLPEGLPVGPPVGPSVGPPVGPSVGPPMGPSVKPPMTPCAGQSVPWFSEGVRSVSDNQTQDVDVCLPPVDAAPVGVSLHHQTSVKRDKTAALQESVYLDPCVVPAPSVNDSSLFDIAVSSDMSHTALSYVNSVSSESLGLDLSFDDDTDSATRSDIGDGVASVSSATMRLEGCSAYWDPYDTSYVTRHSTRGGCSAYWDPYKMSQMTSHKTHNNGACVMNDVSASKMTAPGDGVTHPTVTSSLSTSVISTQAVTCRSVLQAPPVTHSSVLQAPPVTCRSVLQAPPVTCSSVLQAPPVTCSSVLQAPPGTRSSVLQAPAGTQIHDINKLVMTRDVQNAAETCDIEALPPADYATDSDIDTVSMSTTASEAGWRKIVVPTINGLRSDMSSTRADSVGASETPPGTHAVLRSIIANKSLPPNPGPAAWVTDRTACCPRYLGDKYANGRGDTLDELETAFELVERTSPGITDLLVQELVTRMAGQTMSERDVESAIDNMKGTNGMY